MAENADKDIQIKRTIRKRTLTSLAIFFMLCAVAIFAWLKLWRAPDDGTGHGNL